MYLIKRSKAFSYC